MAKDYMTIGDRRVRVELNWNAVAEYCSAKGETTIGFLSNVGKMPPSELAVLVVCAVHEGERLDGRECSISVDDVLALPMRGINRFIDIYARQAAPDIPEDAEKKE